MYSVFFTDIVCTVQLERLSIDNLHAAKYVVEHFHPIILDGFLPYICLIIIVRHTKHLQAFIVILFIERFYVRKTLAARYTPACPEVEQNVFAFHYFGEADGITFHVQRGEVRRRHARLHLCQGSQFLFYLFYIAIFLYVVAETVVDFFYLSVCHFSH